jgi:hypothetical protein
MFIKVPTNLVELTLSQVLSSTSSTAEHQSFLSNGTLRKSSVLVGFRNSDGLKSHMQASFYERFI